MADAFEMREDGHSRFFLYARHQALAATGHDDIEIAAKAAQHFTHGTAIRYGHELDGGFRQVRGENAFDERLMDRLVGARGFRAAAQHGRIASFQAKRARICRHIRAAFIDDADHAERYAYTLDVKTVRTVPFGDL